MVSYGAMNKVYAGYFADAPPVRAAVQVTRLSLDALVGIMAPACQE